MKSRDIREETCGTQCSPRSFGDVQAMLGIADSNGNSLKHADASGKPFAVAGESLQSQKFPERFWINPAGEFHPIGRNSEHAKWIQDYARMTEEQAVSRGWIHGYKLRDSVWLTTGKQFSRAQKQTIDEYFTADNSVERVMLCVPAKGRPSIFSGRFKPYLVKPTYQGESVDKLMKARDVILGILESPDIYRKGKTVMAGDQPLKTMPTLGIRGNIAMMRQPDDSFFAPAGFTLVYFMDSEQAAKDMIGGKIPFLMVPVGTSMSGGSPITDVWKRRFAKPGTGQEHILGLIQAITNEKLIYINMMSVRAPYRRNSINRHMIETLKSCFPNAEVRFSDPTGDGRKFIKKYTGKDRQELLSEPPQSVKSQ